MTDKLRKAAQDVLNRYDADDGLLDGNTDSALMEALRAAIAETHDHFVDVNKMVVPEAMPRTCNPHPDAPHGFNRNASAMEDRYVCDCEYWEPSSETGEAVRYFYSGPQGSFFASDMAQGEAILMLMDVDDEEWTATELPAPPSVDALIAEAVAKEREACALTCKQFGKTLEDNNGDNYAEEIRARGGA